MRHLASSIEKDQRKDHIPWRQKIEVDVGNEGLSDCDFHFRVGIRRKDIVSAGLARLCAIIFTTSQGWSYPVQDIPAACDPGLCGRGILA
jgi:hypothetical protein